MLPSLAIIKPFTPTDDTHYRVVQDKALSHCQSNQHTPLLTYGLGQFHVMYSYINTEKKSAYDISNKIKQRALYQYLFNPK